MKLPDKNQYTLDEVIKIFDIDPKYVKEICKLHPSIEEAQKHVDAFKALFKRRYRKLIMIHHPDHGGDKENFQVIQKIYETMMKSMKVVPQRQRPKPVYQRFYFYSSGDNYTSASSTTTTSASWSWT